MSDVIRLLPDSVANQIAAGEVIQRPASVIKELVENAIDAGATDIRIFIKDAGRTLIQVVDNGKGMSETDARMAFERHATSKITQASDLFSLRTMGFRGEALPSICAVSQVELKTALSIEEPGTRLLISGSVVEKQEPCVCEKGTNIMVRNLFFNVPARRKFLKSDNVELSNIMREFERLALVNNSVRMSIDTGNRSLDLRSANLKQRITDIWKNNLNMQLLPIEVDTAIVRINGYISRPEYARRRNPLQYLIVNGRNMRHPYFHKAIVSCYDSLIASDTQPNYFLKFEVDPDTIDVNIHPTKNEIKFENEQQIWPILQAAIRAALGKFSAVPSIDFDSDVVPVSAVDDEQHLKAPTLDLNKDYNPFSADDTFAVSPATGATSSRVSSRHSSAASPHRHDSDWERLYEGFMAQAKQSGMGKDRDEEKLQSAILPDMEQAGMVAPMCLQYDRKYIVTTSREGLVVIDQYRAHLKILFEEYMRKAAIGENVSQGIMFPEPLHLDPEQAEALAEIEESLTTLGFTFEHTGECEIRITSVPSLVRTQDASDVILGIIDSISDGSARYGDDGFLRPGVMLRDMALVMARSGAVSRGRKLTPEEMENIVGELFSLPDPTYTPDGNRIYLLFNPSRLDRLFDE